MAKGVKERLGVDWAIAVSPAEQLKSHPSGFDEYQVCFSWLGPDESYTRVRTLRGDLDRVKQLAVGYALDGIRKHYGD